MSLVSLNPLEQVEVIPKWEKISLFSVFLSKDYNRYHRKSAYLLHLKPYKEHFPQVAGMACRVVYLHEMPEL